MVKVVAGPNHNSKGESLRYGCAAMAKTHKRNVTASTEWRFQRLRSRAMTRGGACPATLDPGLTQRQIFTSNQGVLGGRDILVCLMSVERRFPTPWSVEENQSACFVLRDGSGEPIAYVYCEEAAAKLLSKDEARRIAANFAKLPDLLRKA